MTTKSEVVLRLRRPQPALSEAEGARFSAVISYATTTAVSQPPHCRSQRDQGPLTMELIDLKSTKAIDVIKLTT